MIDARHFTHAVTTAAKAADVRPALPAHGMLALTATDGTLICQGSGLDTTIGATAPYDGDDMTVAVPALLLSSIVRTLGDAPVSIAIDNEVTVRQGRSRWTLPIFTDPLDSHTPPAEENGGTVPAEWLRDVLPRANKVADTGGQVRGAVLFGDGGPPSMIGVAHSGAKVWTADSGAFTGQCDLTADAALPFADEMVTVRYDDNRVHVHDGDTWAITSRHFMAKSIDPAKYLAFAGKELPHHVHVVPDDLLTAVTQATVVADKTNAGVKYVTLDYRPGALTVVAEGGVSEIDAKTEDTGKASFNSAWLSQLVLDAGSGAFNLNPTAIRIQTDTFLGVLAGIK